MTTLLDSPIHKFSDKDPTEIVVLAFDFGPQTSPISAAAVTSVRVAGAADSNPSTMILGAATVIGDVVYQKVRNGVRNTDYHLTATADLVDGQKLLLVGELCVRKASPLSV
jgi:hypothetical protein